MALFESMRRMIGVLRSPKRNGIAAIVGDSIKVRREVRFLLLRASVFCVLAMIIIVVSAFSIRRGAVGVEERRELERQIYSRFESMARLSHSVVEGRAALQKIQAVFPHDDNLLPFLNVIDAVAKKTGNKSTFRFDQGTSMPASGMEPYRFISYVITLQGDAQTFLRYLEAFQQIPYVVVLDNVTMQGGSGIEKAGSMLQLKGRLYVQ